MRRRAQKERKDAFDLLEQHLGVSERERYAQRLETLGRVLFGDLWEEETRNRSQNSEARS